MDLLKVDELPAGALLLLDTAPIIYVLEHHPDFAPRFIPLFEAQATGQLSFAVTTITISEVLTGPLRVSDEALVRRYRGMLESWQVVTFDAAIAESAARLRATHGLELADAVQAASAVAINAAALVTHERDFSRMRSLRVIS